MSEIIIENLHLKYPLFSEGDNKWGVRQAFGYAWKRYREPNYGTFKNNKLHEG